MKKTLRNTRPAAALTVVFSLLCASLCAPAGAQKMTASTNAAPAAPTRLSEDQRVTHVLNRLGFGPRPGDIERVKQIGVEKYIEEQLHPERIKDETAQAKVSFLPSLEMTTAELYARYPAPGQVVKDLQRRGELPADLAALRGINQNNGGPAKNSAAPPATSVAGMGAPAVGNAGNDADDARRDYRQAIREYYTANDLQAPQVITAELQASRILRAVYSERQLHEVMVDFWTNHFNVFASKGADRWLLVSYDRDTIRPHAMGNFSELLRATAQSPAMLFYLDNAQSMSPDAGRVNRMSNAAPRRRPFQRRAAEAMPANTQAQQQPPPRARRGINENYARELMELHTLGVDGGYTQKDVQEVARCFTGWTIVGPRRGAVALTGDAPLPPDIGQFQFNSRWHDDGEKTVLGHKIPAGGGVNDGLKVLEILAQHPATAKFIAAKLSRRFVVDEPSPALVERVAAAYTNSRGDVRSTLRAIFASPEFDSPATYRAKIKTPFELAVSAMRALGAQTNGLPPIHRWIAKMGEPLYLHQAPTGYPDTAEAWVNTGALLERLNFGLALSANRIPGTRVNLARNGADKIGGGQKQIIERFIQIILQGDASAQTRATLLKQAVAPAATTSDQESPPVAKGDQQEAAKIAGLVLGSPEFQRQ